MNKATLAALRESIKHWEKNVAAKTPKGANPYGASCALCAKFAISDRTPLTDICRGCPVMEKTGQTNCFDTPWMGAVKAYDRWRSYSESENVPFKQKWVLAARAELTFLKSLLPKRKRK